MRVAVHRSGGLANVGAHAEADTAKLPRAKADEVERLVKALPAHPAAPKRAALAADAYQYDITVDDGSGPKTYRADDLSLPDDWRKLVELLLPQG
jgi:hypothetical protein